MLRMIIDGIDYSRAISFPNAILLILKNCSKPEIHYRIGNGIV